MEQFINGEHKVIQEIQKNTSEQVDKIYNNHGLQIIKQCDIDNVLAVSIWENINVLHIAIIAILITFVISFEIASQIYKK
jgi:hypothetical protein